MFNLVSAKWASLKPAVSFLRECLPAVKGKPRWALTESQEPMLAVAGWEGAGEGMSMQGRDDKRHGQDVQVAKSRPWNGLNNRGVGLEGN